jgi:hypothetical protein
MFTHRAYACERVIKRSHIYGRVIFKFAVNILHITTSSMCCIFSCARTAYTRASASVRARARVSARLSLDGLSPNLLGTCYMSPQIAWATFNFHAPRARGRVRMLTTRACVCLLIFELIFYKFGGDIQQIPRDYMVYLMCVS